MKELAWAAYHGVPPGMEPGLEAVSYYDPPNLTYPFGAYICVLDVDVDTGETKVRRFYALDDCGTRINPMIIEGQIHGGLTEAFGIAFGQEIHYDETGNVTTASFQDYFMPTAVETPHWETDWTTTPSPHHPIGAKGVGESPNVGGVPCFANAVNDAFRFPARPTSPCPTTTGAPGRWRKSWGCISRLEFANAAARHRNSLAEGTPPPPWWGRAPPLGERSELRGGG